MSAKRYVVPLGILAVLYVAFRLLIPEAVFYPRGPRNTLSDEKRAEWSREFHSVGLADVPKNVRWHIDTPFDGKRGYRMFSTDERAVRAWLGDSGSIRTARVKSNPDMQAYLVCMHSVNRGCMVTVRHLGDEAVRVGVITRSIGKKRDGTESRPHSCEDTYRELESAADRIGEWNEAPGS